MTEEITYDVRVDSYDFRIYRGETWNRTVTVLDENENPKDLTGYTAKMEIRDKPGGTLIDEVTVTISALTGEIGLALTAAETAALTFRVAYYDLRLTSATSTVTPLISGRMLLTERVTQ